MEPRDRLRRVLLVAGAAVLGTGAIADSPGRLAALSVAPRFVVFYGLQDEPALGAYDVAVLDSDVNAAAIARKNVLRLGYLSLCEVHRSRAYAAELERAGLLFGANPNWPDARFVDLRDSRWRDRVVDRLVPTIVGRGFDGLFLDTLDAAEHLETLDPRRYGGMCNAAVALVQAIRRRHPDMPIMVNRGYALLPRIVGSIDMLLGESVHSTYDSREARYRRVDAAAFAWQHEQLLAARRLKPQLRLFSLDYWSPDDPAGIARLYAEATGNGFVPYVGTIDLTRIVARP